MVSIRYALRQLRRSPSFSLTVILTVALGVGANTAIFTLVHAAFLKSLPIPDPNSLYRVGDRDGWWTWDSFMSDDGDFYIFSYDLYRQLRDNTPEFDQLTAADAAPNNSFLVRKGSESARILPTEWVSGNYFTTLGIGAFVGRVFSDKDDVKGAAPVAVMSYAAWQAEYGGDDSILGTTVNIAGLPVTIIGITPPGFFGDRIRSRPPAMWLPLNLEPLIERETSGLHVPEHNWLSLIGRLRPGVSATSLQEKMSTTLRLWLGSQQAYTANGGSALIPKQHVAIVPGGHGFQGVQQEARQSLDMLSGFQGAQQEPRRGLYVLMSFSGLLLLITCANIANLLLARGAKRKAETSIRMALGAGRARLIQQLLTESLILSCLGGVAGLLVAKAGTQVILSLMFPSALRLPIETSPSLPVLAFAFLLSLVTGIAFGIAPAWITSGSNPAEALRGLGRTTASHASLPQKSLIVIQAALSVILLVAAGLLTKSVVNLQHQDFGIRTANRYVLHIDPFHAGYTPEKLPALCQALEQRFGSLPGVHSVGLTMRSPFELIRDMQEIFLEGQPHLPNQFFFTSINRVSPRFLETVAQPIIRGRGFTNADATSSHLVAVVNQGFANKYFPNEDPIGRHFGIYAQKYAGVFEIVGVVADAKYSHPRDEFQPMFFRPLTQQMNLASGYDEAQEVSSLYIGSIILLFRQEPHNVDSLVRQTLKDIDPNLAVIDIRSLDDQVSQNFAQERMIARLTMLFGALALLLACIGLYGITSYTVARRTSEIGLRMALGADRRGVLRLVMRGAFAPVFLGLGVGLPIALLGARLIADQLYKVRPYDPLSILIAVAVLSLAAGLAGFLPARRAATIDPMQALRTE